MPGTACSSTVTVTAPSAAGKFTPAVPISESCAGVEPASLIRPSSVIPAGPGPGTQDTGPSKQTICDGSTVNVPSRAPTP